MACYISSNQNRFYAALETSFGAVQAATAENRIPAIKLGIQHETTQGPRRDKTGSRTKGGIPTGARTRTRYQLGTYMTNWGNITAEPSYGPLVRGALGAPPVIDPGKTVASVGGSNQITFGAAHGLTAGQAVSFGGEIRFVAYVVNGTTVELNAPFSLVPTGGSPLNPTITYSPATLLPSVSIYDYWSPATAVQRIVSGAGVDRMKIKVNADYHEFEFSGDARDLIDSASFAAGLAGLSAFPEEPAVAGLDYSIIPGHIGQVWIGAAPTQFFTLIDAEIDINNNVDMRKREFGFSGPTCIAAGEREVGIKFRLYEKDDAATVGLYQAAKNRTPISIMIQLGQSAGQLCGVYLPAVVPEVPEFDDRNPRLEWNFSLSQAQGSIDDEIQIAFA
ncbi:MAG TPA: hypothetical protein VFQ91_23035 [Bryobacteraceae bacterium]|nr:hypothetical protein [Bryobacteraceae bacterium]